MLKPVDDTHTELTAAQLDMLERLDAARRDVLDGKVRALALVTTSQDKDGLQAYRRQWAIDLNVHPIEVIGALQVLSQAIVHQLELGDPGG